MVERHLKVGDRIFDRAGDDLEMKLEAVNRRIDRLEEDLISLKEQLGVNVSEAPKGQ